MKWKKHILDAIWHGDSFFESGTPVLKQTGTLADYSRLLFSNIAIGVWRLINPKADPWQDSPSSSPVPRRKMLPKKMRSSPSFSIEGIVLASFCSIPFSPLLQTYLHKILPLQSQLVPLYSSADFPPLLPSFLKLYLLSPICFAM